MLQAINALATYIKNSLEPAITIGKVTSVSKANRTCDVSRFEQTELVDVRLNAVVDEQQKTWLTIFPAIDSYVVCIQLDEPTSYAVIAVSEIESSIIHFGDNNEVVVMADKLAATIGNSSVEISKDEITFNKGSLEGLVIAGKLTERLNATEKAFNSLLNHYKSHEHACPQGSTAGFVVASTQEEVSLTEQAYIENPKIVQ